MPKATAKTKGVLTPPAKSRTDTARWSRKKDVIGPTFTVPNSDVGEGSMGGHGMEDLQPGTSTDPNVKVAGKFAAESILFSDIDVRMVCENDFRENFAWLKKATNDQKKLLRDYLLNLDASNRIDFNSERSQDICKGVNEIMLQICKKMKECDPRFTCNLVPMGSANNQTKIDDLNEFDYVCELITSNLLQGKGTVSVDSHTGNIDVHFANRADYDLCKPFTRPLYHSSENTNPKNIVVPINNLLVYGEIYSRFCDILESVLQELELPPNWCHGGFNRPTCSGWRYNGVAFLLQFDYLGTCENAPLRLSVDFVPMVRIPIVGVPDIERLQRWCIDITGVKHCWVSPENEKLYYSNAEELLLTEYSSDSIPKSVMRIDKVLERLLKITCKKIALKISSTFESLDNESTIWQATEPFQNCLDAREYVTYSDLGETRGDGCLLKSYFIKRTVMNMMSASEAHGHKWTEDDLPYLVICLYMRFVNSVDRNDLYPNLLNNDFHCENRLSVPLGDNSEKNKDLNSSIKFETVKHSSDFKLDETITYLQTHEMDDYMPIFVYSLMKPVLFTKLSGIFQLFRSVCEGLKTAEIVMHQEVKPSMHYKDIFVTKEEYQGKAIVVDNRLCLAISRKID